MTVEDETAVTLSARMKRLVDDAPSFTADEFAGLALGLLFEALEEDEARPPTSVEVMQRFLRDGRNYAWEAMSDRDWRGLAVALDGVITQALDNEAGWTCNERADLCGDGHSWEPLTLTCVVCGLAYTTTEAGPSQ